jgi:hypothetical protein
MIFLPNYDNIDFLKTRNKEFVNKHNIEEVLKEF